jgi:cellulose synthase/poly-beta-1,6-N-acetylglucosamine synthase-like glycosyltransferase
MKLFFLVLAKDEKHVDEKIEELKNLGVPYLIICGRHLNHPNVLYRKPQGKYDAINFGARFVPEFADVVVLNDVDTKIHNFQAALHYFNSEELALVFVRVFVRNGPQRLFYVILDLIRRRLPITASGELMLIRRDVLRKVLPIKPCKAEDSYILFKVLEFKYKAAFCEKCYTETERTKTAEKEEMYKRKTVAGIYQALAYTKPPYVCKLFYFLLPIASPLLLVFGKKGYFWMKGILLGLFDYLRGDRTGVWQTTYMK